MRTVTNVGVFVIILLAPWSFAFHVPSALVNIRTISCTRTSALFAGGLQLKQSPTSPPATEETALLLEEKKRAILDAASGTNNGISATDCQMERIDAYTRALELLNPTPDPARSDSVEGTWRVRYSTAPPPSNGQLGPLRGAALQSLDLASGIYANELLVGADEADPWLSTVLLAVSASTLRPLSTLHRTISTFSCSVIGAYRHNLTHRAFFLALVQNRIGRIWGTG